MGITPIILGISPGTRFVGIAILSGSDLIDFRIKSFKGKWNERKPTVIGEYIEKIIERYTVHCIAIKRIHETSNSNELIAVNNSIRDVIRKNKLPLKIFSISDLKSTLFKGKWRNKLKLLELLSITFPEITYEFQQERRKSTGYYLRLAEAIAVALTISK